MWDMTVQSSKRLDAFNQWCLRHILRVHFAARVTNHEIRRRSAPTACHSDNEDQAFEVIRPHRPPRSRRQPHVTCPQRRHWRPAEGLETTTWSSSTNVVAHCRAGHQTTESGGRCGLSSWSRSLAWNRGNAPAGACYMTMMQVTPCLNFCDLAPLTLNSNLYSSESHHLFT